MTALTFKERLFGKLLMADYQHEMGTITYEEMDFLVTRVLAQGMGDVMDKSAELLTRANPEETYEIGSDPTLLRDHINRCLRELAAQEVN
jgi:hypothetical protein